MHTNTTEFEFQPTSAFQRTSDEFEEIITDFDEIPDEFKDKTEVVIFTINYCIQGKIALVPGARLTDYIVDAKPFIAVTEVEVKDKAGNLVFTASFLNINRDYIELILPVELLEKPGP